MTKEASRRVTGLDPARLAAVRPQLEAFVDRGELAGIVTLASRGGEIVHADAIGWADIEAKRPMRADTLFRIASMTKPITSAAALMLMEEGKLALEDPINRWIPELANLRALNDPAGPLNDTSPAAREITVEDLFTHRSGIAYAPFSEGPL
jgi:CubicO group peptidase (beta-lactamase class C family)